MESAAAEPALRATSIARALHGAFCRGVPRKDLLQLASSKIHQTGQPYSNVYVYLLQPDGTVAAIAHSGAPPNADKVNAPAGPRRRAVSEKTNYYMSQVSSTDYQTQGNATRSALLVLIRRHEEIIGAIDIESDLPDAFTDAEQAAVVEVADALAALL